MRSSMSSWIYHQKCLHSQQVLEKYGGALRWIYHQKCLHSQLLQRRCYTFDVGFTIKNACIHNFLRKHIRLTWLDLPSKMPAFTTSACCEKEKPTLDLPSKMPAFTTRHVGGHVAFRLDLPSKMPAFTTRPA